MMRGNMIKKTWIKTAAAAVACAALWIMPVQAEYVHDDVNGVSYNDRETLSVDYAYDYARGGGTWTDVRVSNDGDTIGNVQSSSPNLIAQITEKHYSKSKEKDYSASPYDENQKYIGYPVVTKIKPGETRISFFAKKAGTYKVSFDVIKKDGSIRCKKYITVTTNYTYDTPIKEVRYAGKLVYDYGPYITKTSGKISVKMNKGFKLVRIEIGKPDSTGSYVYKKIKNNAKIKLVTKNVYTQSSSDMKQSYNALFPETAIRVYYIKNKDKTESYTTYDLYTINKK
ncbi:MAG: hypothetical protein K6E18_09555 [Lachnospiraceae bacterium]|nr:hypothetical protein [Lachnospiraceae bacterium]